MAHSNMVSGVGEASTIPADLVGVQCLKVGEYGRMERGDGEGMLILRHTAKDKH